MSAVTQNIATLKLIARRREDLADDCLACIHKFQFGDPTALEDYRDLIEATVREPPDWTTAELDMMVVHEEPERETRSTHLTMRLKPSEKERILQAVRASGLSVVDYLLSKLDDGASRAEQ